MPLKCVYEFCKMAKEVEELWFQQCARKQMNMPKSKQDNKKKYRMGLRGRENVKRAHFNLSALLVLV